MAQLENPAKAEHIIHFGGVIKHKLKILGFTCKCVRKKSKINQFKETEPFTSPPDIRQSLLLFSFYSAIICYGTQTHNKVKVNMMFINRRRDGKQAGE